MFLRDPVLHLSHGILLEIGDERVRDIGSAPACRAPVSVPIVNRLEGTGPPVRKRVERLDSAAGAYSCSSETRKRTVRSRERARREIRGADRKLLRPAGIFAGQLEAEEQQAGCAVPVSG